jgi:NADH-quinone oxidoreductase subunit N
MNFFFEFSTSFLFGNDYFFILPEAYFFLSLLMVFTFGTFLSLLHYFRYAAVLENIFFLLFLIFCFTSYLFYNSNSFEGFFFNAFFYFDSFSINAKILLTLMSSLSLLASKNYLTARNFFVFEYPILIGFSLFGLFLLISSLDALSFYLALELQSFCIYILTPLDRRNFYATEAGLKYFLLGALSSGLILFGICILYGFFGTTNFESWKGFCVFFVDPSFFLNGILIGFVFFFIGIFFKLGFAPFHFWLPDIYEGSALSTVYFFSTVPKFGLLFFLWKFYSGYYFFYSFDLFFTISFVLSFMIGTAGSLLQFNVKRFFAYSAIAQGSFFIVCFLCRTEESVFIFFFYSVSYFIMVSSFFAFFLNLFKKEIAISNKTTIRSDVVFYFSQLKNFATISPSNAVLISTTLFSFAGIPPLLGFFNKMYVLWLAFSTNYFLLLWISFFFSLISSFYYLRVIKLFYFDSVFTSWPCFTMNSLFLSWFIYLSSTSIVFFFCYPQLLLSVIFQFS